MKRGLHCVDSSLVKGTHARIMVERVVHAVHADDVDTKRLQIGNIASASSVVG